MKILMSLFIVWSVQGAAQSVCPSIWVFKPWKACKQILNMKVNSGPPTDTAIWSNFFRDNGDGAGICNGVTAGVADTDRSLPVSVTSLGFDKHDAQKRFNDLHVHIYTDDRYECIVRVQAHPVITVQAAECGEEAAYQYQQGGSSADIPANQPICVTCDDSATLAQHNPELTAQCILRSVSEVINSPSPVTAITEAEYAQISATVSDLRQRNKNYPIPSLQDSVNQDLLDGYLNAHPAKSR